MDRLSDRIVSPECEGDVAHSAADQGVRQGLLNAASCLDVVDGVVVVLLDAGGDRENIGIEDYVLGRESHLFGQDTISAPADLDLPVCGIGLALLIERHHNYRRSVAANQCCLPDETLLAFLQADGVHHPFPLNALESSLDD